MSQLYRTTDEEFNEWLDSNPSEDDLREALLVLEAKKASLWDAGELDSYHRDRYERDATYMSRLRRVKAALTAVWLDTGQIKPL